MRRALGYLAAVVIVLATSAAAQTLSSRSRAPVRLGADASALSGAQIRAQVIGNTITGVEDGETYAEYLAPDGTISGEGDSGAYAGFWRVAGDQLCFRYDDDDAGGAWDCASVTLIGASVYWSRGAPAGAPPEATLLAGNPKKL